MCVRELLSILPSNTLVRLVDECGNFRFSGRAYVLKSDTKYKYLCSCLVEHVSKEVEEETKIYQTAISRYEKGEREPDLETLAILADFYQVSVDWLLGTKGNNK